MKKNVAVPGDEPMLLTDTRDFSPEVSETLSAVLFRFVFYARVWCDTCKVVEVVPNSKGEAYITVMGQKVPLETAGTDGKTIWLNREFFRTMPLKQRVFVFCHEILHVVFMHMHKTKGYLESDVGPDGGKFNRKAWGHAGDYIINALQVRDKVGEFKPGGLLDHSITKGDDTIEDVYTKIMKQARQNQQSGSGGGDGDGVPDPNRAGEGGSGSAKGEEFDDCHVPSGTDMNEADEASMRRTVEGAAEAARMAGELPGGLKSLLDQITNPKVPWERLLRQEESRNMSHCDPDWSRPNRRRLAIKPAIIMPTTKGYSSGTVVYQIDTSGSIRMEEISAFLGNAKSICEDHHPERIIVLWVHTDVWHVDDLEDVSGIDDVIERVLRDGVKSGGTDMVKGLDWVDEWEIEPTTHVIVTDGYTPFGDEPEWPVVWCITTDVTAPWGTSIKMEID